MDKKKYKIIIIALVLLIVLTVCYYSVLPKFKIKYIEQGYKQAEIEYASLKVMPLVLPVFDESINQTVGKIQAISICSQQFIENYKTICEVNQYD